MQFKTNSKVKGQFWFPSNPNEIFYGTLLISPEKIQLDLSKLINKREEFIYRNEKNNKPENCSDMNIKYINGYIRKKKTSFFVRLNMCYCINIGSREGDMLFENSPFDKEIHFSFLVESIFSYREFNKNETSEFNTIGFSIEDFDLRFKHEYLQIESVSNKYQINCPSEWVERYKCNLNNYNMKFTIGFGYEGSHRMKINVNQITIKETIFFILDSTKPLKLKEYEEIIDGIVAFFSFVCNKVLFVNSLAAKISNQRNGDFDDFIDIYNPNLFRFQDFEQNSKQMFRKWALFDFEKIESNFEEIINKWLESWKYLDFPFLLYFHVYKNNFPYSEASFLTLMLALESYHRLTSENQEDIDDSEFQTLKEEFIEKSPEKHKKWVKRKLKYFNQISLQERIKQLIYPFESLFSNQKKINKFIEKIKDYRNDLTHYDEPEYIDKEDIPKVNETLKLLFKLLFLRLIGFHIEEIRSIVHFFPSEEIELFELDFTLHEIDWIN